MQQEPTGLTGVGLESAPEQESPTEERQGGLVTRAASTGRGAWLPLPGPVADLPRPKLHPAWLAICFLVTLGLYLYYVPRVVRYSSPPTGDQAFYLMVMDSIVQDHDLNVANNYASRDEDKFYSLAPHPPDFVGMTGPYPLQPQVARSAARPQGEIYDTHIPGLALLLAGAWAVGGMFSLWWPATIVVMCLIGALVAVNIFLLAYEMTGSPWIAVAVWMPLSFSNPIMSYSFVIFTELTTGLLLIYAFRRLAMGWGANGPWRLFAIGLCIAYIPCLAWRSVIVAAPLGLYALVQWWRYNRALRQQEPEPASKKGRLPPRAWGLLSGVCLFLPILTVGALLLWYNLYIYGTPFPPDKVPELGDVSPFTMPWAGVDGLTSFVRQGFALFLDRQAGFLTYAPIYILAAVGMIAMAASGRRSDRRLLAWIALFCLPYLAVFMMFYYWNGLWCPSARYLTTLAPLMAAPLAMSLWALGRSWAYKAIYGVLAIPGIFLMSIVMYDPRLLWPANPVLGWLATAPESPLRIDVRGLLPAFEPLDERTLPRNTAWEIAFCVLVVFVCYLLLLAEGRTSAAGGKGLRRSFFSRRLKGRPEAPYLVQSPVLFGAVALVAFGWFVMNHDYLKHKTVLVQEKRWGTGRSLQEPLGLAFLNGGLYLADYRGASVGRLDTATGGYAPMVPISSGVQINFTHPGDVKVGPGGLLYVLNNGDGEQALLVVQPDGMVVRGETLNGKSPVGTGLSFGPDGKLYVADRAGGRIYRYASTGGDAEAAIGGMTGGFNNIIGVTVDGNGAIYAAVNGDSAVQQIDSAGNFVRKYDLPCQPSYMASSGNWLDVSCSNGIVSINKQTGDLQRSEVLDDAPPLNSPTGMAYGPDGMLYVLDGNDLVAYRVAH